MSPKNVKDGYDKMHAYFARLAAMRTARGLRRWLLRAYWAGLITREILVASNKTIGRRRT